MRTNTKFLRFVEGCRGRVCDESNTKFLKGPNYQKYSSYGASSLLTFNYIEID